MPYFNDACKYAKYMVLSTFLFAAGLQVLIAKQSSLNFSIKFSA
jgi:hypothetical protein